MTAWPNPSGDDDAQRTFLRNAKHDLQGPIRRLRTFVSMLKTDLAGAQSEDVRDDLEGISTATQQMEIIVESLMAHALAQVAERNLQPLQITDLVNSFVSKHSELVSASGVGLHVEPSTVTADRTLTAMALEQVLLNAIRFRHLHRPLEVRVAMVEPHVMRVTDTGTGLRATHVMTPFIRGQEGDKTASGGHGLGLNIAQAAMQRQGGDVVLGSPDETGATVDLRFASLADGS